MSNHDDYNDDDDQDEPAENLTLKIAFEAYRQAIRRARRAKRGASKSECDQAVVKALTEALADERITIDEMQWAARIANQVDRSEVSSGKRAIRKILEGQMPLAGLLDDVVCPLGRNAKTGQHDRCFFADLTADRLMRADQERFRNVEQATVAFSAWRSHIWDVVFPVLQRTPDKTFKKAWEDGDFEAEGA